MHKILYKNQYGFEITNSIFLYFPYRVLKKDPFPHEKKFNIMQERAFTVSTLTD